MKINLKRKKFKYNEILLLIIKINYDTICDIHIHKLPVIELIDLLLKPSNDCNVFIYLIVCYIA